MAKAKVIRGVYVRGKPFAPGAILDVVRRPSKATEITPQEFSELRSSNYAMPATEKDIAAPVTGTQTSPTSHIDLHDEATAADGRKRRHA